jgi:hypothetical protein
VGNQDFALSGFKVMMVFARPKGAKQNNKAATPAAKTRASLV